MNEKTQPDFYKNYSKSFLEFIMTIFIASRFRTTAILKKNENKNFSVFPENCLEGEKEAINDDDKK